jgi:hypothetical protein
VPLPPQIQSRPSPHIWDGPAVIVEPEPDAYGDTFLQGDDTVLHQGDDSVLVQGSSESAAAASGSEMLQGDDSVFIQGDDSTLIQGE